MTEVVVPWDRAAERAVLGSVMLSPTVLDDVLGVITPADMHDPRHETVLQAAVRVSARGDVPDVIAVVDELLRGNRLDGGLDAEFVHDLTSAVPSAAQAEFYASLVAEKAQRRRLAVVGARISGLAADPGVPVYEAVEQTHMAVDGLGASSRVPTGMVGEYFHDFVKALDEKPTYLPTPWGDINRLIHGFKPGGLYVVGARPSQGKTLMGLQAAAQMARSGLVVFISLEMGLDEIMGRLVAQFASVSSERMAQRELSSDEWHRIADAKTEIDKLRLSVLTSDHVSTMGELRAAVAAVTKAAKTPLKAIVVDYLQLLTSGERHESRQVEVAGMSRTFKLMAQKLNVPVIALSQLNRGSTQRRSPKPTLADLRESGSIEQDADAVLLLHRDEKKNPGFLEVLVAKNRQGRNGEVRLVWEGEHSRVLSRSFQPQMLFTDSGRNQSQWQ